MEKGDLRNTWRRENSETHGEGRTQKYMEKGDIRNTWRTYGEGRTHKHMEKGDLRNTWRRDYSFGDR